MAELRKTGESQYEVVVDQEIIGRVWNWHGSWSVQVEGKTYHGLKSRKKAVERVERVHELRGR
jgi:hypothetical protein